MSMLRLTDGQTAIVGYGSLISRPSIERTLRHEYDGFFGPCHVAGWRRSWDVAMPNQAYYFEEEGRRIYPGGILYLNVRPSQGGLLNAVLFVVNAGELEAMHRREWIYEPRVVTSSLRGVAIQGGDAVMYVGRPDYLVGDVGNRQEAAVRASYVRIVEDGLQGMSAEFRAEYERTTDPVPGNLIVNDALDSGRPNPNQLPTPNLQLPN